MDDSPTLIPYDLAAPAPVTSLALGCLTSGHPSLETVEAIERVRQAKLVSHHLFVSSGPYLDDGRNDMMQQFLDNTDASHLLIVDDDIDFTVDDVRAIRSYAPRSHCVSGQYPNFDGRVGLIVCAYHLIDAPDPATYPAFDDGKYFAPILFDDAPHECMDIDSAGAGFMLISRALLEYMVLHYPRPTPWWQEPIIAGYDSQHVHLGEDHGFALRLKALDVQMILAPIRVTHIKRTRLKVPDPE